jgi:hypothetical protein
MYSITFPDFYSGYIACEGGGILYTSDGGDEWSFQLTTPTFNNFKSVCFINTNVGWIAGDFGTILKTTNGGIPVELTSFTATANNNEVTLDWTTATETNNSGFEIERQVCRGQSAVGNWNSIGFVPGFGTTTEPKSYSFIDESVTSGTYKYRLKQIDFDGSFTYSNEAEVSVDFTPKEFVLYQNYPNPFNPNTVISYQLPVSGNVTLKLYDVLGNEITTLVNEEKQAGVYEVEFDGSSLASGMYLYKLQVGTFVQTKKMILLK